MAILILPVLQRLDDTDSFFFFFFFLLLLLLLLLVIVNAYTAVHLRRM